MEQGSNRKVLIDVDCVSKVTMPYWVRLRCRCTHGKQAGDSITNPLRQGIAHVTSEVQQSTLPPAADCQCIQTDKTAGLSKGRCIVGHTIARSVATMPSLAAAKPITHQ